jgi:sigma-B regulation protein RsbU (phosphoserine phosphatase)
MVIANPHLKLDPAMAHWQRPAGDVGGDFVVFQRDAHFLRLFVGDVTGHGEEAARAAEQIRPMIERELEGGVDEARLRRWSKRVYDTLEDRFVAMTCLEIDLFEREAVVAVAGNPAVLIRRADDGSVHQIQADGMPLGLVDEDEWFAPSLRRVSLNDGDEIICFTDGLTDTLGRQDGRRFGLDRVLSVLAAGHRRSPIQTLRASHAAYADPAAEQDDVTVFWIGNPQRKAA